MEFSRSEVKIVDASTMYVNRWKWYKYLLVATILVLIWFCYFLITTEGYGVFLVVVGPAIGFILGYLSRNWETPKKEALLLKLVTNQKHLTNRLTKTPANNAGTDSQTTLAR